MNLGQLSHQSTNSTLGRASGLQCKHTVGKCHTSPRSRFRYQPRAMELSLRVTMSSCHMCGCRNRSSCGELALIRPGALARLLPTPVRSDTLASAPWSELPRVCRSYSLRVNKIGAGILASQACRAGNRRFISESRRQQGGACPGGKVRWVFDIKLSGEVKKSTDN